MTTAYYLVLSAHGLDLTVPDHRLVSVNFGRRDDYLAFLNSQGANAFRTTLGYFHPNFRAVMTYDPRPAGQSKAGPERTSAGTTEPPRGFDDSRPDSHHPDFERRRLLSDLVTRARVDGTAAHELIHLLVTESGLSREPGEFPLWLHEGFAAQFEVVRGGRWAGVGRAHDLRLPDWHSAGPAAALEPLIADVGFGHGYRREIYAASWSLVYFLRTTRPREFSAFLDLLRSPAPDPRLADPARFVSTFRSAFGDDLRGLESEWHAYMREIQTPLEEHAAGDAQPPPHSPTTTVSRRAAAPDEQAPVRK